FGFIGNRFHVLQYMFFEPGRRDCLAPSIRKHTPSDRKKVGGQGTIRIHRRPVEPKIEECMLYNFLALLFIFQKIKSKLINFPVVPIKKFPECALIAAY